MICNFLGDFEKPHSGVKTTLATFWATFGKIGLLFTFYLVTLDSLPTIYPFEDV